MPMIARANMILPDGEVVAVEIDTDYTVRRVGARKRRPVAERQLDLLRATQERRDR